MLSWSCLDIIVGFNVFCEFGGFGLGDLRLLGCRVGGLEIMMMVVLLVSAGFSLVVWIIRQSY